MNDLDIFRLCIIFIFGLFIGFCGVLYQNATSDHQACLQQPQTSLISTTEISSLSDNTGVTGRFVWGSGYVGSYPVYAGYVKNYDDSFSMRTYNGDISKIYNDLPNESTTGYVEEYDNIRCYYFFPWTRGVGHGTAYKIHIPKNGLILKYNLDGEI